MAAAIGRQRVEIGDGLASIEFLENGRKARVARPDVAVAGHEADAVRPEHLERVLDFMQHTVNVRHRHGGEETEATGMVAAHLRPVIIADSRQTPRLPPFAEPHPRGGD